MTCPETAPAVGAYVLGALDPEERRRFEAHLDRCPACAAELAEFRGLPDLLARVRPEDLEPQQVTPSPDLFARVVAAAAAADAAATPAGPGAGAGAGAVPGLGRASRRPVRRRLLIAAAVVAVAGAGAGVATGVMASGAHTHSATAGPVHMSVTADAKGSGTALDVTVEGLPPNTDCRLVVVDAEGRRHPAGEWAATYAGQAWFRGWSAVDRSAVADVVLLDGAGRQLVRVPF